MKIYPEKQDKKNVSNELKPDEKFSVVTLV